MKRILSTLTLLLCFALTAVNAQVITAERAAEIANSFFSAGVQKSGAARGVVASSGLTASFDSNDVVDTASANPTFYVLTNPEGGFVIVSGEETENPIIGYSLDGTINADNLPIGFVDYMTDIDAQVKALREYNANNPQKSAAARSAMARTNYATSMGNIVRNLQVAKFHQEAPFNNLCKTANGSAASAGCVPIAYAMLCNYYNWPVSATGKGVHSATGETITFGHEYDWDNILDDYSGTYTTAQADAVATLVRDLGYAYQVSYGTGGTGSELKGEGAAILIEQFGFKSLSTTHASQTYATTRDVMADDDRWKGLIKDCLDKNYPIPYSAYNTSTKIRHIFMLDGYTDNDYYHFNWGWGDGNGWFTLDDMVPSTNKTYTSQHYAYFYLIPNKTEYAVKVTVGEGEGTVSINNGTPGTTATASLFNGVTATLTAYPADGYALASWTKNGVVVGSKNTIQVTVGTDANDYVANFADESTVTIVKDYTISSATGELTNDGTSASKFSQWASTEEPVLRLNATCGSTAANSMSIVNDVLQLYAYDYDKQNGYTYTINAPDGYLITSYSLTYYMSMSSSYNITVSNGTTTQTASKSDQTLSASGLSTESTSFTLTGTAANNLVKVRSFTVTIQKEGANVPSTPTTYTINVNAETGGNAYVNGTNTSATVNAGTDVTLQAYTNGANYTFAGWYNGSTFVSNENPYTFALNSDVTYTAKFNAVATTYTVTTTANPADGGTAKFSVGTGSQKTQGDVENGTQITLYATANTGYTFVKWTLNGATVSTDATCNVNVAQAANYVANFEANTPEQPGESATDLGGKWFRLKVKNTSNYMNIANNTAHTSGTVGGVNVTSTLNDEKQVFCFDGNSTTGYKLKSKGGYYITCQPWNVDAISTVDGTLLTFETAGADNEYFIKWDNTNKDNGKERDDYFKTQNVDGITYVYCDAAQGAAATWVLEEVVYYTVTATAGEGGRVSPPTSTVEQGKSVTLTATANEGYRFVNWTLNGNVVSTEASYTFNATAAGEYVANFEISTYTISATANPGTAGSVTINGEAVSSKNVNENSTVTLVATPQAGYCFVNWTLNGNVESTDARYTFNATAAGEYVANFEQIVVNVTFTDAQSNTYNVQLDGFTNGVTTETVAAKLTEKYPYITLGDNATLNGSNAAYTYSNKVTLPFKVSDVNNATSTYWYNIYYPSNGDARNPNYIAALNNDAVVDMAASPEHAYGENPTYNTNAGNPMISWAIYSANNSLEFIFKNELTNKYIKVESVVNATGNTQNVKFVDNAEDATAFTLLKDVGSYNGDYALVANIDETTGYLCAISSDEDYVTHFDRNNHQGAWVKFKEAPDYYTKIMDLGIMLGLKFGAGDGKYIITNAISDINDRIANNSENITLNTIKQDSIVLNSAMNNWPAVRLTINPVEGGATSINGEENVVHKYVPNGYELPLAAVPAVGYHFVSWTDGTSEITAAEYTKTISGGKGDVIALTANFAKDTYTINVSTNGTGGSASASAATVEHGNEVTLTAVANDGYEFVNWTKGTDVVSTDANYTVTNVTANAEYVANFRETTAPVTYYIVKIETEGLSNDKFAAYIHTGTTQNETQKSYESGSTVKLLAIQDNTNVGSYGYAFEGWYLNGTRVSEKEEIEFAIESNVTYTAKFVEGIRISVRAERGWPHIYLYGSDKEVGGTSMSTILVPGRKLKLSVDPETGCRFASWKVGDNVVSTENPFTTEPLNETVTYKAICEPASYELTVRANNSGWGTVSAESVAGGSGTEIIVGHNMEATITATANTGYRFVNWTKGTNVVSTEATFTIAGIENVEDMLDAEYVAVFEEIEEVEAGTYYRIAYNFEVPVAAKTAATRAAGDVQTLTISFANGSFDTASRAKIWTSNSDSPTVTLTATYNGNQYRNICYVSDGVSPLNLSLDAYPYNSGEGLTAANNGTTFTIAVDNEDYKITAYSILYSPYSGGYIDGANNNQLAESGLNVSNVSFTVKGKGTSSAVDIQNFTVTIQQVGGETPEPETETVKYYVQSEACGVSGKENALKMTTVNNNASSIFYCADSKLMSYSTGTFINENGNTRGLQAVGVPDGDVTFESNKIKFTNGTNVAYMHAKESNGIYYVDNCGATATCGNDDHNFIFEVVESLPVTISSVGYASFYAPVAVIIPEGIEAYYLLQDNIKGSENNRYASMTKIEGGVIPANTGVILTGKDGKPATTGEEKIFNFDITTIGDDNEEAENIQLFNILDGTAAAQYITEGKAYVLGNKNGIGFYWATTEGQAENTFLNNSHKAYLLASELPQDAAFSAGFRFVFGGTTAIEKVESRNEKEEIYDLTGRKLEGISGTGIYIINGKKVLIK